MDFAKMLGIMPPESPPAQFGGKQQEIMPGADADAGRVRSVYQDKVDLKLGIGGDQFWQQLHGMDIIGGRPHRNEMTAPTVTPNAFDLSAVLHVGINQGGVYLRTLEQDQRENRDETPMAAQRLTTPIAPIANLERIELRDETQVFLI